MSKAKILLVEDDRFIAELYERALVKGGYEVEKVIAGPEALDVAKASQYDFILLDIMVPEMTGVEVLEKLRGDKDMIPNTNVVITTNLDQDDESRAQVERLADGYLIKADITPKKLVAVVDQMHEAGPRQQG